MSRCCSFSVASCSSLVSSPPFSASSSLSCLSWDCSALPLSGCGSSPISWLFCSASSGSFPFALWSRNSLISSTISLDIWFIGTSVRSTIDLLSLTASNSLLPPLSPILFPSKSTDRRLLHLCSPSAITIASASPILLKSRDKFSIEVLDDRALLIFCHPSSWIELPLIVRIVILLLFSISLAMCWAPSCVRPQSPRSKFISDGLGFSSIASIMTCTPLSAKGFACNLQHDKKKRYNDANNTANS